MYLIDDLKKIKEEVSPILSLRHEGLDTSKCPYKREIVVCGGTGCASSDSLEIKAEFDKQLKEAGLDKDVLVYQSGCFGLCEKGPVVVVFPEATFYSHVKPADVEAIVTEHLVNGNVYLKKAYTECGEGIYGY